MTPTDEQLARDYQDSGDQEFANELVRRYLPKVRRIVFPMVLNDQDADDVTQEVLVRAIRGLNGFQGGARLSTWMTRIALNTTYTYLRRRRPDLSPLPAATLDPSGDRSPVQHAIGHELDHKIQRALDQLSPKLRAAIVLTAIDGLSPNQAAEVEDCSPSAMHSRIHEARKQLRNRLKEYLVEKDQ